MSKDPNPNPPPKGGTPEILEDQVYRASLAEGNSSLRRANPLVTVPLTLFTWVAFGGAAYLLATQTSAGKAVVKKTIGIDLQEQEEAPPPPPPPPPPPAPVARPAAPRVEARDTPPPPPLTNSDIVPEIAPTKLPERDLSQAYMGQGQPGGTGAPSVAGGGVGGTGMAVVGSSTTKVVDFDFSQIKIKYQPPAPPYPPLAKIAKIQGTVVVEITIGIDGIPIKAQAVDGPPQLRPAAETYAMQWKFEPAMLNGVPQTAKFKLTMPFRLK
jgi:protein TonB